MSGTRIIPKNETESLLQLDENDNLDIGTGTLTVKSITMSDGLLIKPQIKNYSETPQSPVSTSTTVLNVEDGNVISFILTEATTISTSNTLADKAGSMTMIITAAANSEYVITWPTTWKWASGSAPDAFAVSTTHVITLMWTDGDDVNKFFATYINSYTSP